MGDSQNIHATGLVLDGLGLLLRGPSGAGKSLLALALLERFADRGKPALLLSDDRVDLLTHDNALIMQAPAQIAGLIELRGRGIVSRPHIAESQTHLVIDLVPEFVRMLEEHELTTDILGVRLARAPVPQASLISLGHQEMLVLEAMRASR